MPFRFWRRIRLAPGVTLNLSKSTASLSLGPRGAKYTISPRGNRATAGLPGTGLFYTIHDRKRGGRGGAPPAPRVPQRDRLKLGFFQRLMTPAEERRFIDGIRALNDGNQYAALEALEEVCQSALERDPLSAPKRDPSDAVFFGCRIVAEPKAEQRSDSRWRFPRDDQARFLKRQLSLPVSTMSQ